MNPYLKVGWAQGTYVPHHSAYIKHKIPKGLTSKSPRWSLPGAKSDANSCGLLSLVLTEPFAKIRKPTEIIELKKEKKALQYDKLVWFFIQLSIANS